MCGTTSWSRTSPRLPGPAPWPGLWAPRRCRPNRDPKAGSTSFSISPSRGTRMKARFCARSMTARPTRSLWSAGCSVAIARCSTSSQRTATILASSYAAVGDSGRLEGRLALVQARVEALLLRAIEGGGVPLADRPARMPAPFSALALRKSQVRRLAARMLPPASQGRTRQALEHRAAPGRSRAGHPAFRSRGLCSAACRPDHLLRGSVCGRARGADAICSPRPFPTQRRKG